MSPAPWRPTTFQPSPATLAAEGRRVAPGSEDESTRRFATMEFHVLGPVRVTEGGRSLALGGPKQRLVLALLIAEGGRTVSTDRLIDSVWDGDPPTTARKTLQGYVHHLRDVVGSLLQTEASGYRFDVDATSVDVVDFEATVDAAQDALTSDPSRASDLLTASLGLWSGTPYADLDGAIALEPEISRLRELRLTALERRIDADLALGAGAQLIGELESLTLEYPLREAFRGQLMRALYAAGRQAEALRVFERTRTYLADEVGLEVSPALRRLQDQILQHDPALDLMRRLDDPQPHAIRGYELRELLVEGEHGRVYRGFQTSLGREVAVKVIDGAIANESRFIAQFSSDTLTVAQLSHPHVAPIADFWREPGKAYIVSPWMDGLTLRERHHEPGTTSFAPAEVEQIASALAFAHRQGVIHGRLSDGQVLFDGDGNAYLAGFDIGPGIASIDSPYSAPEVRVGGDPTVRSDVYSLAKLVEQRTAPGQPGNEELAGVVRAGTEPDPERRYARVEDFLRAFRRATGRDVTVMAGSVEEDRSDVRNPYKGLRAFLETDAGDFFGRSDLVTTLLDVLERRRVVVVVGPSGSGKSSVVRAGLIPTLRERRATDGRAVLISEMYPGSYPFEELSAALMRVAVDQPSGLLDELRADERGLLRVSKQVLPDDDSELVLVIDQFEELFSMVGDEPTRALFLANLVTAVSDERSRVAIVITLRADFFDRPLEYPDFAEFMDAGLVMVPPLSGDGTARAIAGPARAVGVDLEAGLVTQIAADVEGQPGGLPLMQYALTEMFEARSSMTLTLDGYQAIGGVAGALGVRAEEIFASLPPAGQEAMRQCFLRLVTVDEGADDVRRRVRRGELVSLAVDQHALVDAVRLFGAARLLSFDRDPFTRGPTVEVAHEALLREWPRLRSWIDAQRGDLIHHRALAIEVDEWRLADRDRSYLLRGGRLDQFDAWAGATGISLTAPEREFLDASRALREEEHERDRKTSRRLRQMLTGVSVLAICAVIAGLVAWGQARRANDETQAAIEAEADAEIRRLIAEAPRLIETNRQVALLLAAEAHRLDPSPATLGALQQVLIRTQGFRGYVGVGSATLGVTMTGGGDPVVLRGERIEVLRVGEADPVLSIPISGGTVLAAHQEKDLVAVAVGQRVHLFDSTTGVEVVPAMAGPTSPVVSLAFDHAGGVIAAGDTAGGLYLWSTATGAVSAVIDDAHDEREVPGIEQPPHQPGRALIGTRTIAFSADGTRVATGGMVWARVWDVASGVEVYEAKLQRPQVGGPPIDAPVEAVTFIGDTNDRLLAASSFNVVEFDLGQDVPGREWLFPNRIAAVSSTGDDAEVTLTEDIAVLAEIGGRVVVLDLDENSEPIEHDAQLSGEPFVTVGPDGQTIAVGGAEGVALFDIDASPLIARSLPRDDASEITFNRDASVGVVSAPTPQPAQLWDLSGLEAQRLTIPAEPPTNYGWLGILDGLLTWELADDKVLLRPLDDLDAEGVVFEQTSVFSLDASPDGSLLAMGGASGGGGSPFVDVFDAVSGERIVRLDELVPDPPDLERVVQSIGFSVDGGRLIAATTDGAAVVWDTTTWASTELSQGGGQIALAEYSPDGRWLVTIATSGRIALRDPITNQPDGNDINGVTDGLAGFSHGPFFTPEGRYMVTTADGRGRLWDLEAFAQIGEAFPSDAGTSPAASWDGRFLGTFAGDHIYIWDLDTERWFDIACRAAGRNLTESEWEQFGPTGQPHRDTCPMWADATQEGEA